jgi:hypothetical protein
VEKEINLHVKAIETWLKQWRLQMATAKCNYVIFSKEKRNNKNENLKIILNNETIKRSDTITFLGITFDRYLSFGENVDKVRNKCMNRLNLLKILSHSSWHLSNNTKLALYKSLIRSVLDYSLFSWPLLSYTNKQKLQVIQNSALRIIFKKDRIFPLGKLYEMSGLETLQVRHNKIMNEYINKCVNTGNPLILEILDDYKNFSVKIRWLNEGNPKKIVSTFLDLENSYFNPP